MNATGLTELADRLAAESRRLSAIATGLAGHVEAAQRVATGPTVIAQHVEKLAALSSSFTLPDGIAEAIAKVAEAARSVTDSPTCRAAMFTARHNRKARRVRWHGRTFADALGRVRVAELDRIIALCDAGRDAIAQEITGENDAAVTLFLLTMLVVLDALDADTRAHLDELTPLVALSPEPARIRSTHAPPPRVSCAHHRRHLAPVSDTEPPATVRAGALRPRSSFATGGHT